MQYYVCTGLPPKLDSGIVCVDYLVALKWYKYEDDEKTSRAFTDKTLLLNPVHGQHFVRGIWSFFNIWLYTILIYNLSNVLSLSVKEQSCRKRARHFPIFSFCCKWVLSYLSEAYRTEPQDSSITRLLSSEGWVWLKETTDSHVWLSNIQTSLNDGYKYNNSKQRDFDICLFKNDCMKVLSEPNELKNTLQLLGWRANLVNKYE